MLVNALDGNYANLDKLFRIRLLQSNYYRLTHRLSHRLSL